MKEEKEGKKKSEREICAVSSQPLWRIEKTSLYDRAVRYTIAPSYFTHPLTSSVQCVSFKCSREDAFQPASLLPLSLAWWCRVQRRTCTTLTPCRGWGFAWQQHPAVGAVWLVGITRANRVIIWLHFFLSLLPPSSCKWNPPSRCHTTSSVNIAQLIVWFLIMLLLTGGKNGKEKGGCFRGS